MYFDRFDICEAYWVFAYGCHVGGDTSDRIFHRLHRMEFKPRPSLGTNAFPLNENAQAIYDSLVDNHPDVQNQL